MAVFCHQQWPFPPNSTRAPVIVVMKAPGTVACVHQIILLSHMQETMSYYQHFRHRCQRDHVFELNKTNKNKHCSWKVCAAYIFYSRHWLSLVRDYAKLATSS